MIKKLFMGGLVFGACYGLWKLSLIYTPLKIFTVIFILVSLFGLITLYSYSKGVMHNG